MTLSHHNQPRTSRQALPAKGKSSWLSFFKRHAGESDGIPTGQNSRPSVLEARKPAFDMADLLIMSTLEQKTPVIAPGTGHLLDTMVQDHLERAATAPPEESADPSTTAAATAAARVTATQADVEAAGQSMADAVKLALEVTSQEAATPAAPPTTASTTPPSLPTAPPPASVPPASSAIPTVSPAATVADSSDGVDLLQREIEMLLRGPASPIPEDQLPPAQEAAYSDTPPADLKGSQVEASPEISQAELNVLVPEQVAIPPTPDLNPSEPPPAASPAAESTQLSEAEGVLADELAALMMDDSQKSQAAATAVHAPAEAAQSPDELTASIQKIMEGPLMTAAAEAPAAAAEPAAQVPTTPQTPTAESASAEVAGTVEDAPLAAVEGAVEEAPAKKGPTLLDRIIKAVQGCLLLIAQILDMPFSWLGEMDKNVLGFAAFLLMLGGVALYVLSMIYH